MGGYEGLTANQLYRVYKFKVKQLNESRENKCTSREFDVLREMRMIEKALKRQERSTMTIR